MNNGHLQAVKDQMYRNIGDGTGLSFNNIALILLVSCVLGIYIFMIYKSTSRAAFYSRDLNVTLAGLTIITAFIMIAMQSSLIVSLGMVGALSIVRFRNAVKNPLDLLYIFWAMSAGIICGVGLNLLAVGLCIVMTAVLLILQSLPNSRAPSLMVIRSDESGKVDWNKIEELTGSCSKYYREKSRNIRRDGEEVIIELKTSRERELLEELKKLSGIRQISFLSHDGELRV